MSLDQDQPDRSSPITVAWTRLYEVPGGTAVGDVLVCTVDQRDDSKRDDAESVQDIGPFRKA